ncbi:hypothetical protein GW17_00037099 [Ensete ventricosum]|uniref:Uncharacterized protein n=1 Tax=Ensete ventricosum TaxID=4639 RepID=A0A444DPB6_ENSVE|nr:hypothetical protein B296_00018189 [Ensete ventricosum]RWV99959.1 hypothetical protein GW17_00037099 [Ensete ventricosum]RZS26724.1 hypothetical protein BHM03_00060099 [Ensete ventricosum]
MAGGHHRLSKVANPSNHLSLGLKEGPVFFFFAVGLAHYTVLFTTLLSEASVERAGAPAPPGVLPVRSSTLCCCHGMGKDSRGPGQRIADSILRFLVPLRLSIDQCRCASHCS